MSLYVGNLHPDCNESVLYKKFSLIGRILSVKVCREPISANSLGYGFVNFENEEDAKKAIDTLNYDTICGGIIRIMWAHRNPRSVLPRSANLVVKNLDSNANELDLKELFSPFGEILSIKVAKNRKGESKGYGFVQFAGDEAADKAIASLQHAENKGRTLTISKFIPAEERQQYREEMFPNNVYVCNLTDTSTEELEKICDAFGDVVSAKVITDHKDRSKGFGFVSFKDKKSAEKAVQELNRLCLNGKRLSAAFVKRNRVTKAQKLE